VNLDRFGEPFHGNEAERLDLHVPLGESQCRRGHEDRPRHRHLLHAGGQVRRLPDSRVVHAKVAVNGANYDLSRIQADADVNWNTERALDLCRVVLHRILHPKRGMARAHGVILVGEGRAEERHDPVPHHLVDGALVLMDRFHHPQREACAPPRDRGRPEEVTVLFADLKGSMETSPRKSSHRRRPWRASASSLGV
jgi:hypothetical protein